MRNISFRRHFLALGLILLLAVTLLGSTAVAQQVSSTTGGLNGVVTDPTGAVLKGATVTLAGPQGSVTVTSDNNGRYSSNGLTPGFYDVTATAPGFSKAISKHNEVQVNTSSTLNLALKVGAESTEVEVSTGAASLDTTSSAVTENLTDTFYQAIPLPRNVSNIFYAAPGVAQGQVAGAPNQAGPGVYNPSIAGGSPLDNLYVVDGVTITDQAFGSIGTFNRYHGALGTGVNMTFIKEVDVKTEGFEPQFGKSIGGIVNIVTKSGGNKFHGAITTYLAPGVFVATPKQFASFGFTLTSPYLFLNNDTYEVGGEFSGYLPYYGMKDKLFFYGAFDPTLRQSSIHANALAPAASNALGVIQSSVTTLSWSGKITYKVNDKTTVELATFADPSKHNSVPSLSSSNPASTASSYKFGSRNSFAHLSTAITPSWLADVSYTYNYNKFTETPTINNYQITDYTPVYFSTPGPSVVTGFGAYEPSKNDTYSLALNTSKTVHFLANHTFSVGYEYDHTNFNDQPTRSGALYAIPTKNFQGTTLSTIVGFNPITATAGGQLSNAQFSVYPTNKTNVTDNTCTICPTWNGETVYASVTRGTYVGFNVQATGRYHQAYANDSIEVNKYLNVNLGMRWEEQRTGGTLFSYVFNDSWSPRLGVDFDPFKDHKGKIYFNYGRFFWGMPLDAAIRQLGNEQDDTSYYFAPTIVNGALTVNPSNATSLNGTPKSTTGGIVTNFGGPSFASSTGEGILPTTKQEYADEYVLGIERELKNGIVLKARYVDRRLGRIIEDIGSQSPEGSTLIGNYVGGIANPGPSTDVSINEQEVTYTPAQFLAANPGTVTSGNYKAPVAGCTYANDTYQAIGGFFINGYSQAVGGACFLNVSTADGPGTGKNGADGIPDGFVRPDRIYKALELEADKRFSNHWLAKVNYRYANLWGNYEGAYRNDNGQSDPGISSLFDFTAGKLGLLGNQFADGALNSDRHHVANLFVSYNVAKETKYVGSMLKGANFGMGLRAESGVPLSLLGDHPVYLNQGEVPIGGRGAAGRTPTDVQLDLHGDYSVPLGAKWGEKYKLTAVLDAFNVTNSQTILAKVQYTQLTAAGVGVAPALDTDYGRPTAFKSPFYARAQIRFEF